MEEPPKVQDPWEIYFHSPVGYTALDNQSAAAAQVITFPVNTTKAFSKIRLDPGKAYSAQQFSLKKIELLLNGKIIGILTGKELVEIAKPLKHIRALQYSAINNSFDIITNSRGDPQVELMISCQQFEKENAISSSFKTLLSLLLGISSFLFLSFFEAIKKTFFRLAQRFSFSPPIRFLLAFLILAVLFFTLLSKRTIIIPLQFLSVEIGESLDIPQDRWKVYLDVEGYSEQFSKTGVNLGNTIVFPLSPNLDFSKIRLDPGQSQQAFSIKSIRLKKGIETIKVIEGNALFNNITATNHLNNFGYDAQTQQVTIETASGDPFFEVGISSLDFIDKRNTFEVIAALILGLILVLLWFNWSKLSAQFIAGSTLMKGLFAANGLLFLAQLISLGEPHYALLFANILWLFWLPGLLIKQYSTFKGDSFFENFIMSLAMGVGVILIPLYFAYALNIPFGEYFSIGLALIFGVIYITQLVRNKETVLLAKIQQQITPKNIRIFTFFNLLFYLFLGPIVNLLCAPLHDPAVIATVANEIIEGGFVRKVLHRDLWNYPPYLQLLTALLAKISFLSTPKTILFLTNLGVITSGFAFGFFWKNFFKNNYAFYLSTLLLLFIAPTVGELYFTAGKNAMILSFIYWFLLLALLPQLLEEKGGLTVRKGLIFTVLVLTAFQLHYTVIFIFPIFLVLILYRFIVDMRNRPKIIWKKQIRILSAFILPSLLFGIVLLYQLNQAAEDKQNNLFYGNITLQAEKQKKAKLGIKSKDKSKVNPKTTTKKQSTESKKNPSSSTKQKKEQKQPTTASKQEITSPKANPQQIFIPTPTYLHATFRDLLKNNSKDYSLFKYGGISSWIGLILLLLFFLTDRKKEILIVLLFALTLIILNNSNIYNLVHYTEVLFFMVPLLTAGFLLNFLADKIQNEKLILYLLLGVLTIIAIQQAVFLNQKYYEYQYYSTLTNADLKAFDYIDTNLNNKGHFVPLNVSNLKKIVPSQGDGSLYLNLTKSELLLSYVPGNVLSINGKEFANLRTHFQRWKETKGRNEKRLLEVFKSFNIKYVYSGAFVPWGRQVPVKQLVYSPNFNLIYDKEGVQIFEIKN